MNFRIERAEPGSPEAMALIAALNLELSGAYPEAGATHFGLEAADVAPGHGAFLVAYQDERAIACGAVRLIDPSTAELKRMYVEPDVRGSGFGRRLVDALEREATLLGAARVVLETGIRQTAAIVLYAHSGYTPIPLYGEYTASPGTSVCLGKTLRGNGQPQHDRLHTPDTDRGGS